jgi:hypothetical protein
MRKIYFLNLFLIFGCFSSNVDYKSKYVEKILIQPTRSSEIDALLEKLVSSNFFEHTQAAQELIEKGTVVIPYLLQNSHLFRKSDDSFVPVCHLVIKIIFTKQSETWVLSQTESDVLELRQIAFSELERRKKELLEKQKKELPNKEFTE